MQHLTRTTLAGFVLAGAAATGVDASAAATPNHPRQQSNISRAMRVVAAQVGDPYVYGAAGPDAYDCSGLMVYAFGKAGIKLPRTADQQAHHARRIPKQNHRRGDFAFYYNTAGEVFHMAVFTGKGRRIIEAAYPGTNVRHVPMWTAPWFAGTLRRHS